MSYKLVPNNLECDVTVDALTCQTMKCSKKNENQVATAFLGVNVQTYVESR